MFLAFIALGIAIRPRRPVVEKRITQISLPKNYNNGFGCDMCNQVVKYIEQLLLNQTIEAEISILVEQLCTTFPAPYDSLCQTVVEKYLPTVLEWLEEGLDSLDICTKIGLCETMKLQKFHNVPNDEVCDMCNELVHRVKEMLENQTIEEEISAYALQYCSEMSWPTSTICKNMVNQYLPSFLKWLDEDVDTLDICNRIGVCNSNKNDRNNKNRIHHHKVNRNNNKADLCSTCETLVDRVKVYLDNSTVEEEIVSNLEGYCNTLSWPMNDLCKSLVSEYVPTIISYVESDIDSKTICTTLGYCTETKSKLHKRSHIHQIRLPKNYNNGFGCDMCNQVVKYIEQLLLNQTIEAEISILVEQLCTTFPAPYDSLCQTVVEKYLPTVLEWLEEGLDSLDICTKIGLCESTKPKQRMNIHKQHHSGSKNDEVCDMCNELVHRVKEMLENQTIEEEISAYALQYCSEMSWPTSTICKNMVNQYLPSFLKWLDEDVDTLDICNRIGVCNSNKNDRNNKNRIHHHKVNRNNNKADLCSTCETLVDRVKVYLDNSTVEEEIVSNLEGYCNTLSWPMNDLCKSLVSEYVPTIISYVESDIDSKTICTTLGYCTETRKVQQCQVCQNWFKWAEDKLSDVTVEGLWKLVSQECPKVPYLKYFCQTINEQNIEQFVSLILSNLPPQQCCEWIQLC